MSEMHDLIDPTREAGHTKLAFLIAAILALIGIAMTVAMGIPGLALFGLIGTALTFVMLILFAMGG